MFGMRLTVGSGKNQHPHRNQSQQTAPRTKKLIPNRQSSLQLRSVGAAVVVADVDQAADVADVVIQKKQCRNQQNPQWMT